MTSTFSLDEAAAARVEKEAAKRRTYHLKRIGNAGNDRARKWQSMAWLYAEIGQCSDAEAASIATAFAAQLNEGRKL
jgi:hypothetical protein